MNYLQKIHVTDYVLNDNGISITYILNGRQYFYVAGAEDTHTVLASIGNTVADGLSQHDAIMIVASHESEKINTQVTRIDSAFDLVEYTREFFRPKSCVDIAELIHRKH